MALYFITETSTREGAMSVNGAPERAKGVVTFAEGFGVQVVEFFYCLSGPDFIMKVEAPDDESVAAFVLAINRSGNVRAEVTRAFTPDEWGAIVDRIPG